MAGHLKRLGGPQVEYLWSSVLGTWGYFKQAWSRKFSREVGEGEAPDHPQGVLPQNWDETEQDRSVICMMLKATANDTRQLALYHDAFRGP
ncbi:hypothetical protein TNCV_5016371 [Trichonephila clavipes]|nr:hypothetical protein TNCV_5016371 [Trichonephila clavipes]